MNLLTGDDNYLVVTLSSPTRQIRHGRVQQINFRHVIFFGMCSSCTFMKSKCIPQHHTTDFNLEVIDSDLNIHQPGARKNSHEKGNEKIRSCFLGTTQRGIHSPRNGIWKKHLLWNLKILHQSNHRKQVLQKLHNSTKHLTELIQLPTVLNSSGMIYALVHLPTNKIFVIATAKRIQISFKQNWYSACIRNTNFHRTISKGKIQDVIAWPLENIHTQNTEEIKNRKKFWIKTLHRPKKWVRKHGCDSTQVTPERNCITSVRPSTPINLHSAQLQSDISPTTKQLATRTIQLENNPKAEKILSCIPSFEEFTKAISDHEKKNQEEKAAELDQPTRNLGGKLTPRFSSESLLNFMHEFATQQEISKMLQGTSYEEAFTDREIEK